MSLVEKVTLGLVAAIGSLPLPKGVWAEPVRSTDLGCGWDDEDVSVFMNPPSARSPICPMVLQHASRPR